MELYLNYNLKKTDNNLLNKDAPDHSQKIDFGLNLRPVNNNNLDERSNLYISCFFSDNAKNFDFDEELEQYNQVENT